uniref:transglycosylase domain-containing protein n=1 Tax=Massilia sp. TaxID=1882437 RepID=UPI002899E0EF
LSGSRSYLRKGQEMVIAFMLETVMSKQRILELYLNVVEFGRGVFGAEAAARYYYKKPAARLSQAEAARLAVMLPNPRYYDKHRTTNYLQRRTNAIVRQMRFAEVP